MGVWRGTRCREISTLPPEGMGIWKWGSIWITMVRLLLSSLHTITARRPPANQPAPAFNFSHIINELSFGPLYPSLLNPLDHTISTTPTNFFKYQYYISIVPTTYSSSSRRVSTNQYAVTSQSSSVSERNVPGIFFKFDIEPILLTVSEEREGLLKLLVRVVNVVSGVLVAGGWCYQLVGWGREVLGGKRRGGEGILHGRMEEGGEGEDR